MIEETTILWSILALIYLILMVQNMRWLHRLREIEKDSEYSVYITAGQIGVGGEPKNQKSVKVTGMFFSILKTDSLGFLLAIAAAVITAL